MKPTAALTWWVGRRVVFVIAACSWVIAADGGVLFPEPIHLIRQIDDPIAETTSTVNEFYVGNRAVRVAGSRVSITDYDRQELTVIDRATGTYSVTSFSEIAKSRSAASAGLRIETTSTAVLMPTPLGVRMSAAGTSVDVYEIVTGSGETRITVEVGIDRQVRLSREAAEAILGAAFPNTRTPQHEAALRAAQNADSYGLPAEQTLTYRVGPDAVTLRNRVTRLDHALPAAEAISIPPGSRRVESPLVLLPRLLKQLDELPSQPSHP